MVPVPVEWLEVYIGSKIIKFFTRKSSIIRHKAKRRKQEKTSQGCAELRV
jgi:hypothetical protein